MSDNRNAREAAMDSLRQGSTDSAAVEAYYDGWAEDYDRTLSGWNYKAPAETAEALSGLLGPGARILDIGCGTGLVGAALAERMDCVLSGLDISAEALSIAKAGGAYAELDRHDLQDLPLPVDTDGFDSAVCVGVLTYIEEREALLREACRAVRAGGIVYFTHRTDLWRQQDFDGVIDALTAAGCWHDPRVRRDCAYLPENADFGDEIRVHHVLARVA